MGKLIINLICAVALAGYSSALFAQGTPDNPQVNPILSTHPGGGPSANPAMPIQNLPPEQRANQELMYINSRVDLTEEQKMQLQQVFSTVYNEEELTKSYNETTPDQKELAMQALLRQKQDAVNKILTPEQQARLNSKWGTGLP